MKILRYISAALIAVTLVLCASSCSVLGGDTGFTLPTRKLVSTDVQKSGDYAYRLYDDGTAQIYDYVGSAQTIEVPEKIDGHTVVSIYAYAFAGLPELTSVKLNPSLEELGDGVFYDCTSLSEITVGSKVISVGVDAFEGTPWLTVHTEEYVVVGDGVLIKYQGTGTYIIFPDYIKHIGAAFIMNETLIGFETGENVLTVGAAAFAGCPKLRYAGIGGNVVSIGEGAFSSCEGLTAVKIPDKVEYIGPHAFDYCTYLTSLELGKSVKTIGEYAFTNCNRMSVLTLPASVETIADYAFYDCFSLLTVFYGGSEEQFKEIDFNNGSNYALSDAIKYYAG